MDVLTPRHDATSAEAGLRRRPAAPPLAVGLFNDGGDEPQVVSLAVSQAHRRMLQRAGAHVRHAYFRGDWHELGAGSLDDGTAAALASPELRRVFADVDVVVVSGGFHGSRPALGAFGPEDVITGIDAPSSATKFSINGTATGVSVPVAATRDIWFRLDMPTTSATESPQSVTVTVTAGP